MWTENSVELFQTWMHRNSVESFPSVLTGLQHDKHGVCSTQSPTVNWQCPTSLSLRGFRHSAHSHGRLLSVEWITSTKRYKERRASICLLWDKLVFLLVSINLRFKKMLHNQILFLLNLVKLKAHLTVYQTWAFVRPRVRLVDTDCHMDVKLGKVR